MENEKKELTKGWKIAGGFVIAVFSLCFIIPLISGSNEKRNKIDEDTQMTESENIANNNEAKAKKKKEKTQKKKKKKRKKNKNYYKTVNYEKIDAGKVKEGTKVKIKIYVEDNREFEVMDMYSGIAYEKKLKSSFIVFGARMKKHKDNYAGENILYFKQGSKLKPWKYKPGQYITIYGEVIERKINGWTGHGSIGVLAKRIEKGR